MPVIIIKACKSIGNILEGFTGSVLATQLLSALKDLNLF